MSPDHHDSSCGSDRHFSRRTILQAGLASAGLTGMNWLTPLAESLARADDRAPRGQRPKSVIVLWLQGGPSQLETFDPHPNPDSAIAGGTKLTATNVPGIQLAAGLVQVAEQMDSISLVRSIISKEGDHERATYNVKTGFRPDPTLVHPSIGAILCHQTNDNVEIPRHVSIDPGQWPARGGYLGDQFDAFKIGDPRGQVPDISPKVPEPRTQRRIDDLFSVVEKEFARGRLQRMDREKTLHRVSMQAAMRMMSSDQLKAFDVEEAPESVRMQFGDTRFGRGCLAAARLVEVGVRCVEVTLNGWDTHANNHSSQAMRVADLDPAFASLVRYLKERSLLEHTVILCGGEFGRTPRINPAGGRDHWPHGFSIALAGGGIRGGRVVGENSPEPNLDEKDKFIGNIKDPRRIADIHATVLHALGVDYERELITPIGRPLTLTDEGQPIDELLV